MGGPLVFPVSDISFSSSLKILQLGSDKYFKREFKGIHAKSSSMSMLEYTYWLLTHDHFKKSFLLSLILRHNGRDSAINRALDGSTYPS